MSTITSAEYVKIVDRSLTERQWQDKVVGTAKALGWICYHTHDSRRSERGFPDLILIRGNALVAIELKTMKGRVRPEQVLWLEAFAGVSRVSSMLARPSDWDEIERVLRDEA